MVSLFVKTGKGREELLIEYIIALISKNIAGVLKWARAAIKTGDFSRLRQTEYRRTPLLI